MIKTLHWLAIFIMATLRERRDLALRIWLCDNNWEC